MEDQQQVLSRVSSYPVVRDTWNKVTEYYQKGREESSIVRICGNVAETSASLALKASQPVLQQLPGKAVVFIGRLEICYFFEIRFRFYMIFNLANPIQVPGQSKQLPAIPLGFLAILIDWGSFFFSINCEPICSWSIGES